MTGQISGKEPGSTVKQKNDERISAESSARGKANHLIHEKSPYLLQHAHNPVDWYPWGEEAFEKALREDKPIFLSIGYSTCHWCHVMAHESFEDQVTADFLNANFVSIKVDREERPGVDQVYMAATRAMTGSGGWPLSLFLFPDKRPFYAGTYFPPQATRGRPGFMDILQAVKTAWLTDRTSIAMSAEQVTTQLRNMDRGGGKSIEKTWLDKGFSQIEESYEPSYGGFAQAPKFPRPVVMDFLLRYYKMSGIKAARDMALFTLDRMAEGGIHDHIGGGFHRYSVDTQWRVPHFEKMLYDQAQLVSVYLSAYQLTGAAEYRRVAGRTLEYVLRDMRDSHGAFYSAEDADSVNPYNAQEHGEGAFYLWTEDEINSLLSEQQASVFKAYYGVERDGNALHDPQQEFSGRNILYQNMELSELAGKTALSEPELERLLGEARGILLAARGGRVPPHRDDKIITAWNGLMISALARASMVLGDEEYLRAAEKAAGFILDTLLVEGELLRRYRDGEARYEGGLDDYSFLVQGLLDLYGAGHNPHYLHHAIRLTEKMIENFRDDDGGFYDSPESAGLLVRMKESYDGAEPSGNSVAALNLLRLAAITGRSDWADLATVSVESFGKTLSVYPPAMPLMLAAMILQMEKPQQIVLAGERGSADTKELLAEIHSRYLPNTLVLLADGGENQRVLQEMLPFIETAEPLGGRATAYVCEDYSCKMPVNSRKELAALLDGRSSR